MRLMQKVSTRDVLKPWRRAVTEGPAQLFNQVYEFVFIASPLKLRGATASPIRPLAIPIQRK